MRCTNPLTVGPRGNTAEVPCHQCLPCRLMIRDQWACRVLLECQSASSSSFWTLTFSPEALPTEDSLRLMVTNFFAALRMSERRAGNPHPIRFFGSLDFGTQFGRPHFHLIIYNLQENLLPHQVYKEGLPRPLFHIGSWPHGHVDSCGVNIQTARYVSKYVAGTDFSDRKPMNFHPSRPPLGLDGFRIYLDSLCRSPEGLQEIPNTISIAGREWPMHPTLRLRYSSWTRTRGLSRQKTPREIRRFSEALTSQLESCGENRVKKRNLEKAAHLERTFHDIKAAEDARFIRAVSAAYGKKAKKTSA